MAQTMNGMIAKENYNEDFLSDINWKIFVKLTEKIGCFIVGRKTYEQVKKWKNYNFDNVKAKKIIVTRNQKFKLDLDYMIVNSPEEALNKVSN